MKKRNPEKTTTMTSQEVGILIEGLRSDFRVFGEGLDLLIHKVNAIVENQAKTLERVTSLEIRVTSIETRLTSVEIRLTSVEKTTKKILLDVGEIKIAVKGHDKRIRSLETASAK